MDGELAPLLRTSLAACPAMEKALRDLNDHAIGQPDGLFDFSAFCSLIGCEDIWAFEKKWGKAGA